MPAVWEPVRTDREQTEQRDTFTCKGAAAPPDAIFAIHHDNAHQERSRTGRPKDRDRDRSPTRCRIPGRSRSRRGTRPSQRRERILPFRLESKMMTCPTMPVGPGCQVHADVVYARVLCQGESNPRWCSRVPPPTQEMILNLEVPRCTPRHLQICQFATRDPVENMSRPKMNLSLPLWIANDSRTSGGRDCPIALSTAAISSVDAPGFRVSSNRW